MGTELALVMKPSTSNRQTGLSFARAWTGSSHSPIRITRELRSSHDFGQVAVQAQFTPHACPARVQAKLAISQPGDVYEQEADQIAEAVTRTTEPPVIQRKCVRCGEDEELQRKESPGLIQDVLQSPGQPLDAGTRGFMESRFGHNFSQVRVHTDATAATSAQAIHALAYTVGPNIVFGSEQYRPQTHIGRRLLAHELTHTIQQGTFAPQMSTDLSIGNSHNALEQEAEQASNDVLSGQYFHVSYVGGGQVARQDRTAVDETTPSSPRLRTGGSSAPQTFGESCSGGTNDPCQQSRCDTTQLSTVQGDIDRAIGYVNAAITALGQSPLSSRTERALDWYFSDHSNNTASEVSRRLGCILESLQDTKTNNRFGCHPGYDGNALAYVCVDSTPVCTDDQTNVCLTQNHFGKTDRIRAQTIVHECAHRVGMSLGEPQSVPDIYEDTNRFLFLDTSEALLNSDSFALFAGSITEGVPTTILLPVYSLTGGFAAPERGMSTWRASLYMGTEFQNPILGIFNPTLGLGFSAIGETATGSGPEAITSPQSFLVSLLPGVRIGNARPGAAGGGYASFFGGPSLAFNGISANIGAEAGVGVGYRWRWLDVSPGIGYTYDPTREAGMQHMATFNLSLTFIPTFITSPGQ